MDFVEVIEQAKALLQSKGRLTYRTLKRQFALDDEALEDLKDELLFSDAQITEADGRGLVWNGEPKPPEETPAQTATAPAAELPVSVPSAQPEQKVPAGERRQLTVMFCDLVGSTALSEQLDPEELQTIVRTYQEVSAQVIERYEGHIAQYLGDGLLVYFGYPTAHEDDASRAVHAGLEIVAALHQARSQFPQPVQVRIGIHTGPVVVGQMGGGSRHEQLALGETPNIAARVQGKAVPDSVVISSATYRLVQGLFTCQDVGPHELKGISTAQSLYQVQGASDDHSRFAVAVRTGLTPLVGRSQELGLLVARWEQAHAGDGQVVLLSGEAGIGKSRLVQTLQDQVIQEGATRIEFHCSPYHQNSALYPITTHMERLLQFQRDEAPETRLDKLDQLLSQYRFPTPDTFALLAALFSLPHPESVPPLSFTPQKQKQLTLAALVSWIVEEAEKTAVYCAFEDLHWADPSTLELLGLLLDQVPTTRLLALLTFRPEFTPPWPVRSSMTPIMLSRLRRGEIETMIDQVTGGKALPAEVVAHVVAKTDGVPIFVEELTKMVVESDLVTTVNGHYELSGPLPALAIPATLHDSLMARLDRLVEVKEVAQLGATLGREFSYELLRAVSLLDESILEQGLQQLVEAELVLRSGLPPQVQYQFKHALVRDTAYQSLLKSTRQQYHQQIAQVLEQQFTEVTATQPELVAQHYTEAGLTAQAIGYWQRAGQRANDRSAYQEAMRHVTTGLRLLQTLPETLARQQQELPLQLALGTAMTIVRGFAAPEVEAAYTRARVLCQQLGDTQDVFPVLFGLWRFSVVRADLSLARQLAEDLLGLAAQRAETPLSVIAHTAVGQTSYSLGELLSARSHLEEGIAAYSPAQRSFPLFRASFDPGVACHGLAARTLWSLGYPDQALARVQDGLALATELAHPFNSATALTNAAWVYQLRREGQEASDHTAAAMTLSTEQGFAYYLA